MKPTTQVVGFCLLNSSLGGNGLDAEDVTVINVDMVSTDTVPPSTQIQVTPSANENGWHKSDITVNLTAADNEGGSGVKEIHYQLSGAIQEEQTVSADTVSLAISNEGITTLTYYSVDNADNQEKEQSVTLKLDKTPPAVSITANPSILWSPNREMVNVNIGGSASDNLSDIASVVFKVTDEYKTTEPTISAFDTIIKLEAWREGNDKDGRMYNISVTTKDKAGNEAASLTTVICPHDKRKVMKIKKDKRLVKFKDYALLLLWLVLVIFLVSCVDKPEVVMQWYRTFGSGDEVYGKSVQQTADGGYIVFGGIYSIEAYREGGAWLIKTDAEGNKLWDKVFNRGSRAFGWSVQQTTDGGYILCGTVVPRESGNYCIWLIKTDADGNTIWDKTFIGQEMNTANSVGQTTDGGYIVCGSTWPLEGERGGYISRQNVWLIKTDADGDKLWDRTFGGELFASGQSVQQTADGGYIIGGTGDTEKTIGWLGPLLMKTDSNGSELWSKVLYSDRNKLLDKILGTCGGNSYSAQQTTDGGYIVCATKKSENVWLIKTDADGNKLWEKTFDKEIKGPAIVYSIQQTTDGGYIVSGSTYSEGSKHVLLLKIAPER